MQLPLGIQKTKCVLGEDQNYTVQHNQETLANLVILLSKISCNDLSPEKGSHLYNELILQRKHIAQIH